MFKTIYRFMREYTIMAFGIAVYICGINQFMLPAKIVNGGASGIGAIVYYATGGLDGGGIPISYTYFAINLVLVIVGFAVLGRNFGIKTIFGIVGITIALQLIPIPTTPHVHDPLLGAIIGGLLAGAGVGIIFSQGGSAGGTDIVALILTKYRNTSVGRVYTYCDVVIIGSSYFFLGYSIEQVAYGYIVMGVMSYCVDLMLSGNKQSVQIFIFSDKYDLIANRISSEQRRGVTLLNATGWYTKQDKKLLMVLARKNETNNIYRIVKEVDNNAFLSVGSVMGVFGKGFENIKVSKKLEPAQLIKKAATKVNLKI
ncbi:MAG: YitT family protein [Prevotellaceae bacterium]|jgi:uncharacterized membrane-anchored protein YitT (DUF2179 family)|nr:YitT family protein [Prevotellaceae bacterium]